MHRAENLRAELLKSTKRKGTPVALLQSQKKYLKSYQTTAGAT